MINKIMGVVVAIMLLSLSTCFANNITCRVTSYTPSIRECGKTDGITASGVKGRQGVLVAADWRVFPPGTILYCQNTKELWVVADVGGAIKGTRIDRFVQSRSNLKNYCSGTFEVKVLYKPNSSRKTAYTSVQKSLGLRDVVLTKIKTREHELTSRGGFDRCKQEILKIAPIINQSNTKKETQNERKYYYKKQRNSRRYSIKNVKSRSVSTRDRTSQKFDFGSWLKGQERSSITTKNSKFDFGCQKLISDYYSLFGKSVK
jgi:3D (Asp-Asp-Asp) domain-containing protein